MQVYLAVPPLADTSVARKVLRSHGADPRDYLELTMLETTSSSSLNSSMPRFWDEIEAVVAVPQIRGGEISNAVLIDIGVAIGRQLPLIVLTEDEYLIGNLAKRSVDSVRVGLDAEDALDSHLSLFLADARYPISDAKAVSRLALKGVDAAGARRGLDRFQALQGHRLNEALEEWVANLLRSAGVAVVSTNVEDRGFDFVISLPETTYIFGPILVEVKARNQLRDLERAALRLESVVHRERASLGLLLYLDLPGRRVDRPQAPPGVIAIGIREILDALAEEPSLEKILWRARNAAVHMP